MFVSESSPACTTLLNKADCVNERAVFYFDNLLYFGSDEISIKCKRLTSQPGVEPRIF